MDTESNFLKTGADKRPRLQKLVLRNMAMASLPLFPVVFAPQPTVEKL